MFAYIIDVQVPRGVKNQRVLANSTSQIMKNGQNVIILMSAPDRFMTPCLMHVTASVNLMLK